MNISKVFIAGDHAAYDLKNKCKEILANLGFEVIDLGTDSPDISVDYPDFAYELSKKVLETKDSYGVLICGTGIGISIAANRNAGIRCALCHDSFTAKMAREHNDANVLCFGSRVVGIGVVEDMCKVFFNTEFACGRHERRVKKLNSCLN
ncbi:allose-6-phosphate isomerase / ribose-5-phosphate isomerase B [Campylobacter blaseri]|uniref:Ribose 5-phosphate isomerase B n=1 Tax=Campylobacter blaseri TaxID=2042961 RepID=A0A2P8QZY5_9BACT|nr:ribose 5-phosphate isomerase B [Campylobacter blaseri]PSM51803.1 ribose 5-phosphate isomerase B [Campylobacter blaseri]PSM53594.1 ribose 5-phosphate isomerase B [Campylobacter blaseri]QKF86406.1 allose-6-phosphate isomerase / ribose-5-phosphate isomerase B [Campylobacter blaseri]